jgi:hypothetical protein
MGASDEPKHCRGPSSIGPPPKVSNFVVGTKANVSLFIIYVIENQYVDLKMMKTFVETIDKYVIENSQAIVLKLRMYFVNYLKWEKTIN